MAKVMMHDSEQDGWRKAAEDGEIDVGVGDLRAKAMAMKSHCLSVLNTSSELF